LESLTKSQTFSPYWPELGLIEPNMAQTRRKHDFQELRVVLHSFYVQLLLIYFISSVNWDY